MDAWAGKADAALGAGPVEGAGRWASIDVLRGVALLGILVMNIQSFAMPVEAYQRPVAWGDLGGASYAVWLANYAVWLTGHLLFDGKMMAIFSMLFGAGVLLMAERREARGSVGAGVHYRRMGILLAIGLAHAYLLWYGDILVAYALCGMAVYPLRRWPAWVLATVGVGLLAVGAGISLAIFLTEPRWSTEMVEWFNRIVEVGQVKDEVGVYRGGWWGQMGPRARVAFLLQTWEFGLSTFWRVAGLMLVGMAGLKWGVFTGRWRGWAYAALAAAGGVIGLAVVGAGVRANMEHGWDAWWVGYAGAEYNYWGSLLVAAAWVGVVMLACKAEWLAGVLRPIGAVGRMALTNYLLQTVLCTLLFYGQGLGWFGRVERVEQAGIVLGIWAVEVTGSALWLRWFRFGPAEWLWRSGTYLRWQPMRVR